MNATGDAYEIVWGVAAATRFRGDLRRDEPMADHTTFKVGGPADVWARPAAECFPDFAAALVEKARALDIPLFILGGGANLVAADQGIRGIVLDTTGWTGWEFNGTTAAPSMTVRSGTPADQAAEAAAAQGWGGLEFLAGLPGSIGGAVWMNARCYERQVSDALLRTEILDETLRRVWVPRGEGAFGYKKSPFQKREALIMAAEFRLEKRAGEAIRAEMAAFREDREAKGHYRFPSAGSVFKNNRAFGKPTGKIIDELGLRGLRVGGAQVAPWHGNIIINTGGASAADIRRLTELLEERALREKGHGLEREIIFVGDYP
ncbi:MAG: UDP-N-acetylmuramate dehydrogenase [Treponema sp.]|jgi:UDP-N-acetylmuramate dehydrogenase|nr:UDP-N-acetylmuramate dehydrogenase [Treponema sp.]